MTYKTKKKLIHFYTSGAVAEDFAATKKRKLASFRKTVRACFYVQCGVFAICAAAGFISGFSGAVPAAICSVIPLAAAFFAAGGTAAVRTLSCILNFLLSAAAIVACILTGEPFLGVCGGLLAAAFAASCVSLRMRFYEDFLAGYPVKLLKREDYTLLRNFSDETAVEPPTIESFTSADEKVPELPPLTSEMRELANRLGSIIGSEK
ncbi:MAG TPA: hypothetical protein DEQ68_02865 [Ruminococcaceae bacterium]|nr:hypothetical protein [Oscillospiraceae bacterium]